MGHAGVSTVVVEMLGGGTPSYTLTNSQSSLNNTINFTKASGLYTGQYRLVVTTTDSTVYYSQYFYLNMVTNYFYTSISYSTSAYNSAGEARGYTYTQPDAWGRFGYSYSGYSSTSSNPNIVVDLSSVEDNLYIYIKDDKFGSYSSNVAFAKYDSEGIVGGFGGTIPVSLNRVASWSTASTNSSVTYGSGSGTSKYLECRVSQDGSINWSIDGSNTSSTGVVDGYWATEDGDECKTKLGLGLSFKTKYSHVSGDTRWVVTSAGQNYSKGTLLLGGYTVRLINSDTIGTVTSVVRVGFYTTSDVLLYEQDITLSVTRTAL
jgi:hypothetical protein